MPQPNQGVHRPQVWPMNFFWQGLKLLVSKPKLWPACLAPTLLAIVIDGVLCWALLNSLSGNIRQSLNHWGWQPPFSIPAGNLFSWIIVLIISGPAFLIAFFSLSPWAFDRLSFQIERIMSPGTGPMEIKWTSLVFDLMARVMFAGFVGGISIVIALLGHPWISAALAGSVAFLDMTAPACLRRGKFIWAQVSYLFQSPNAILVLLIVILISWVPLLNILIMPWLVATGTLFVASLSHETEEYARHSVE